ncbi:hypothetical protein Uis1B_1523 [Bifidobacterium margollesii]|uniref:Uncharacterized protein n=1 Tax=Bifidobacterium margollesii TaxID=2020964 RepID=A0A2N5J8Z6_9BIFI|nr:hypothetical protein Uis1B_1523 [Bifidobacterium margollesii]
MARLHITYAPRPNHLISLAALDSFPCKGKPEPGRRLAFDVGADDSFPCKGKPKTHVSRRQPIRAHRFPL